MIYYCKKCQKYTEHTEKKITVKAGDSGYTESKSYICIECNFAPLFIDENLIRDTKDDN